MTATSTPSDGVSEQSPKAKRRKGLGLEGKNREYLGASGDKLHSPNEVRESPGT